MKTTTSDTENWLALISTLPARNTAARMRLWRAIKGLGCATLRDGVYLLPERQQTAAALAALASEVRASEGSAEVLQVVASSEQLSSFLALFDRSKGYGHLLARVRAALAATVVEERSEQQLRREFSALAAIDYFPGAARRQVESALAELAARVNGEPRPGHGAIRKCRPRDYQERIWVTRQNLWVDRLASAWLIRRFIDPAARFVWLEHPGQLPEGAIGFDFDGAAFTHVEEKVTFEVLAVSFSLAEDQAIARLAGIVHYLDAGGAPVAEAAGLEAILTGLRMDCHSDDQALAAASTIFDVLYTCFSREGE